MNVNAWSSRVLVNALIGFCKQDPSWPDVLRAVGWKVSVVEPRWLVDLPDSPPPGQIKPDLVLALRDGSALLLWECKVGTVQADQLERYLSLSLERLRAQSHERPLNAFQLAYAGTEPHRASCVESLTSADVPLLVFDNDRAYVANAKFEEPNAAQVFSGGVDLSGCRVPMHYVPIDSDSPEAERLQAVMRALISLAINEIELFDARDVLRQIFGDSYGVLHQSYRTDLANQVERTLGRLAGASLLGSVLSKATGTWTLSRDFGSGEMTFRAAIQRIVGEMQKQQQLSLDV